MIQFRSTYSRSILTQLVLLSLLLLFAILINLEFITDIYFRNQATRTGYIVNGSILLLFTVGLFRIISLLMRYSLEESALATFLDNVNNNDVHPIDQISKNSLIARRYRSVVEISKHNVAVNHSALASTLIATESTRLSLPKFISNILILTGVFGTIVSLSIALLGASNIVDSGDGLGNMGMVIHGMSTALSTTTTAIVCYLFFGYFYLKVTDVQTQLLSGIEQATTLYIMPRFTFHTDSMLQEVGTLVRSLREAAHNMGAVEADFAEAGKNMNNLIDNYVNSIDNLNGSIREIKHLLRSGFRLPD